MGLPCWLVPGIQIYLDYAQEYHYPADPNCTDFITILMNRMTYGDTIAVACLENTCWEILAQKCRTALARDILLNQRYVDDTTGGDEQKAKLLEALLNISEVLKAHVH